eukprot:gene12471-347_t
MQFQGDYLASFGPVGVSAVVNKSKVDAQLKNTGEEAQFEAFKKQLEEFSQKHRDEISGSPALRQQFHKMCQKLGVDPLQSQKSFWGQVFGSGDFYYELAMQASPELSLPPCGVHPAIEICITTRPRNAGLMPLATLVFVRCPGPALMAAFPPSSAAAFLLSVSLNGVGDSPGCLQIDPDDVEQAIRCVKGLGSGFQIVRVAAGRRDKDTHSTAALLQSM